MRKESFDRKNEKYGADRRFRTHPADRTKRRNVDGRYEEQKPKKRNADRGRVNESRRIKKLRKRKKARFLRKAVAAVFCVAAVIAAVLFLKERFLDENYRAGGLGQAVNGFLKEGKEMYKAKEAYQSIDKTDENADTLKDLLDKNPETWEFVKNYSKMKDASPADTIGEVAAGEIPLLLQWDERWGYSPYGTSIIAVSGCGPTCVSMLVVGLTGDKTVTPSVVADYATQNHYVDENNDTTWAFMTSGVEHWGLTCVRVMGMRARSQKNWRQGTRSSAVCVRETLQISDILSYSDTALLSNKTVNTPSICTSSPVSNVLPS